MQHHVVLGVKLLPLRGLWQGAGVPHRFRVHDAVLTLWAYQRDLHAGHRGHESDGLEGRESACPVHDGRMCDGEERQVAAGVVDWGACTQLKVTGTTLEKPTDSLLLSRWRR